MAFDSGFAATGDTLRDLAPLIAQPGLQINQHSVLLRGPLHRPPDICALVALPASRQTLRDHRVKLKGPAGYDWGLQWLNSVNACKTRRLMLSGMTTSRFSTPS